jgi:hypothetical protein
MINLPWRIAEQSGQFSGRAWLVPRILNWLERIDERVFLLTGDPGGKSMIVACLVGFGARGMTAVKLFNDDVLRTAVGRK